VIPSQIVGGNATIALETAEAAASIAAGTQETVGNVTSIGAGTQETVGDVTSNAAGALESPHPLDEMNKSPVVLGGDG
jgi:type IV secretory pathway TrbL component